GRDQMRRGEGNCADVIAVDERDQDRPKDQLDLKRANTVLVEKMRNLNFRLARHRFPPESSYVFLVTAPRRRNANYGTRRLKKSGHCTHVAACDGGQIRQDDLDLRCRGNERKAAGAPLAGRLPGVAGRFFILPYM